MRVSIIGLVMAVTVGVLAIATVVRQSCSYCSLSLADTRSIVGGSCRTCCELRLESIQFCPAGNDIACDSAQCYEVGPEVPWQCEPEYLGIAYHNGAWATCERSLGFGYQCRVQSTIECETHYYCQDDCHEFGPHWICFGDPLSEWPVVEHDNEELYGDISYCA